MGRRRHITLQGGRTKQTQIWPDDLCTTICRGMRTQKGVDAAGLCVVIGSQSKHSEDDKNRISDNADELNEKDAWMEALDDVTGRELNHEKVRDE